MKIKIAGGNSATLKDIESLGIVLRLRISQPFIDFARRHDGGKPMQNWFDVGGQPLGGVNRFIPIGEIPANRQLVTNIPAAAYPVAHAACGNYILIDEGRGGEVFFWDHETGEMTSVASDFSEFLKKLEPLDPPVRNRRLEEGEHVWVRPGLLEQLRNGQSKD